jgi:hypothetical protein
MKTRSIFNIALRVLIAALCLCSFAAAQCPSHMMRDIWVIDTSICDNPSRALSADDYPDGWFVYRKMQWNSSKDKIVELAGLYWSPVRKFEEHQIPNVEYAPRIDLSISPDGDWILYTDIEGSFLIKRDGTEKTEAPIYSSPQDRLEFYRSSPARNDSIAEVYLLRRNLATVEAYTVNFRKDPPGVDTTPRTVLDISSTGHAVWEVAVAGNHIVAEVVARMDSGQECNDPAGIYFGNDCRHITFFTIPDDCHIAATWADRWYFDGDENFIDNMMGCGLTISGDGRYAA